MKLKLLTLSFSLFTFSMAFAQTGSDYLQAMKKADVDITFDVTATGKEYKVNWGMDAAWDWDYNVIRGVNFIGKGNFATGRVSFQPNDLVKDNGDGTYSLTTRQQKKLKWRCDLMKLTGTTEVNINCDHEALFCKVDADGNYPVDAKNEKIQDYTGRTNYQGKPEEWYKLIKASVAYVEKQGLKVVSISPFNEPDYVWEQAKSENQAMKDFLAIAKLLKADDYFKDIRICGGNTLNDDKALSWYNYLYDYLDEGNTHQLAGSFDNYADFFTKVKADGKIATADELHNVGEAIVGVNYGMENGIWWGFDSKARGQFCIDSNEGVRIGYGENRDAWTSGAVYRNDQTGEVHGYLGSSERQASSSSFAFISTTKDVYFNGYGPTRMYVYDVPGGTGYQKGQINAERLFDITWGEDVAPDVIDGTYQIMNASSKKMLTYQGTSPAQSATRKTSGTTQQWKVAPGYTDGDISYWFIDNNHATATSTHLNVLNNNLNAGAEVICYDAGHSANEQWYLKYAQDGYYYIISRLSNKYLYCPSTTSGANVSLQNAPAEDITPTNLKKYLWRFMPIDAKAETNAPEAPTQLSTKQHTNSVELAWTAPTDDDALTYILLRAEKPMADGVYIEYNTIGRNITGTTFIDNTATPGQAYLYKVKAVDYAGNRSEASETIEATTLTQNTLVSQWQFDGDLTENSANALHASYYGTTSYGALCKSGVKSLKMDGKGYAQIPYSPVQGDEITIATWVRWGNGDNWQRVFDFGNGTSQYMFFTPSTGSEMRFVMKNGGDEQILTNGKKLTANVWKHIAVTLKPVGEKVEAILYLDGEKVAESSDFTIKPSDIAPSLCYIGRSMFAADPFFNGYIDDLRIYNYALSADQVKGIMEDLEAVSKDLNEDETAIKAPAIAIGRTLESDGNWYNLNGHPADASQKGFLIRKGKKVYRNK